MISVCFRFDDPSPTSDHDLERSILELFARFDVPLCVATIPFSRGTRGETTALSAQDVAHLLNAAQTGRIEIAQHGHSHVRRGVTERGVRSEFAGVPLVEQRRLIGEGLEKLRSVFGQPIKGFVPPWNTYDRSTVEVVAQLGFEFLSAGEEVIEFGAFPIVPRTCTLHGVREHVERARRFRSLSPVFVVVFHPDDFEEFRFAPLPDEPPPFTNLKQLEALLESIRKVPEVKTDALSHIAASVRSGMPLQRPDELNLPYRVKAKVPPMLARTSYWTTVAGVLWGAFRTRLRAHA